MKRIFTLFFTLIVGLSINANPIALPTIEISELFFDDSDYWKLELGYYEVNQSDFPIDSIFIYSTSDTVKIPKYEYIGSTGVFVITNDSLENDFVINRFADTIKVVSYITDEPFEDILIYGSHSGALINFPRTGQSICKYSRYFVKDNSPTIGILNDTIGICGTLKGVVYDKYSEIVNNRIFRFEDHYFESSSYGEYAVRVYSKPSVFNDIKYQPGLQVGVTKSASIAEIAYLMEPDSIVETDIYLLDTLSTGISDIVLGNTPITIYPNPVSINEKINVRIDLPIITSNIWLGIIDLNGKLIRKEKISQTESLIDTPAKCGIYIVNVWLDSQMISSKKIVVND